MGSSNAGVLGLKILKAIVWCVYAIATAACIILAFGFVLLMFDASAKAGFAAFIYDWSVVFAQPFAGMIEPTKLDNGGIVSWSALFAVVAYAVLAALIGGLVNMISRRIYREARPATVVPAAPVPAAPAQVAPATQAPVAPVPESPVVVSDPEAPAAEPAAEQAVAPTPAEPRDATVESPPPPN